MKVFSREELAKCDGKSGRPALVAYGGKVYDVSSSFHWRGGVHQVLHKAGEDLTESLKEAPHSADLFNKFPIVGTLRD